MPLNTGFIGELKHEANNTRKILSRIPEASFAWRPHEKSMTLERLACHVAELPQWVAHIINSGEFDFAKQVFNRRTASSSAALMDIFETCMNDAIALLETVSDEQLNEQWMMRRGEVIAYTLTKKIALRNLVMNHIIHHRGQLSVYLRLLNVPVPGLYGPSADERPPTP
ncbi:MAG: DinB family protein [Agriterribacter sp.]